MTVRFRPWALLAVALIFPCLAQAATDGMRYYDHWKSLGISNADILLIDRRDLSRSLVERFTSDGVSVHEYLKKPWKEMGVSESEWFDIMEKGSDVAALEGIYEREDETAASAHRPNLVVSFLLPGYHQIKEERYVSGVGLAAGAATFAVLTFADRNTNSGNSIKFQWPVLWGVCSFASAADIWYRYYREQSVSGFSFDWRPRVKSVGLSWRHSL